ncbi:MAG: hypothetical protein KDA38_02750, partial [Planctomycetales bacterium]|nr:hypothetical protein [Planctomycetales bacterium]
DISFSPETKVGAAPLSCRQDHELGTRFPTTLCAESVLLVRLNMFFHGLGRDAPWVLTATWLESPEHWNMEGMEEGSLFTLSWPTMLKATDVPIVRRPSYRRKISAITVRLWRRILPNASKPS